MKRLAEENYKMHVALSNELVSQYLKSCCGRFILKQHKSKSDQVAWALQEPRILLLFNYEVLRIDEVDM
jgi:hypothetical protein